MQHTWNTYGLASLVALTSLAAACSDATSAKNSASQLGFTTGASLGANADAAPITVGGHTLNLTAVSLTVSRAEAKPAATAVCADDNEGADDDHGPAAAATGQQRCKRSRRLRRDEGGSDDDRSAARRQRRHRAGGRAAGGYVPAARAATCVRSPAGHVRWHTVRRDGLGARARRDRVQHADRRDRRNADVDHRDGSDHHVADEPRRFAARSVAVERERDVTQSVRQPESRRRSVRSRTRTTTATTIMAGIAARADCARRFDGQAEAVGML